MKKFFAEMVVAGSLLVATSAFADEPGWEGRVVKVGAERQQVQQTDVLNRPYRPFHVYGNTVRRRYYRGTAVPTLRDISRGSAALVGGR